MVQLSIYLHLAQTRHRIEKGLRATNLSEENTGKYSLKMQLSEKDGVQGSIKDKSSPRERPRRHIIPSHFSSNATELLDDGSPERYFGF